MSIGKYQHLIERPTIEISDVILSSDQVYTWNFFDINVQIFRCKLDSVQMILRKKILDTHLPQKTQNPVMTMHNSSFKSLNLHQETITEILDCHVDVNANIRPTLITAENSSILIKDSTFAQFVSNEGPTFLYAHSGSHVTIETSHFLNHHGPRGILHLIDGCFLKINGSLFSSNLAKSIGFSTVSVQKDSLAVIKDTVFMNNKAMLGGALIAEGQCRLQGVNCTFTANKAIVGGAIASLEGTNLAVTHSTFSENRAFKNEQFIGIELPHNQSFK